MTTKSPGPAPMNRKQAPMEVNPQPLCHHGQPGQVTDHLLTVKKAAQVLGMSERWFREKLSQGKFTKVYIGKNQYRIRWSELERFIEEGGAQ